MSQKPKSVHMHWGSKKGAYKAAHTAQKPNNTKNTVNTSLFAWVNFFRRITESSQLMLTVQGSNENWCFQRDMAVDMRGRLWRPIGEKLAGNRHQAACLKQAEQEGSVAERSKALV